jgi:hypothetical protein
MHRVWRMLRKPAVTGFFTGIVLQALINSLYTFRAEAFLATALAGATITLGVAIAMAVAEQRRSVSYRRQEAFAVKRRGLVFTVGLQPDTIRLALTEQAPDYVGFICSAQSEEKADALVVEFHLDDEHARKKLVDPLNVEEIRQDTATLLDWMAAQGLGSRDVAVDVTGGMTSMSVAVYSLARDRRLDCQYISSRFDKAANRLIANSQDARLLSRYA